MSLIREARRLLWPSLVAGGLCLSSLPGCAVFSSHGPSTVARGKYYSSGDPHYDEFFIALYKLQVSVAEAPRVPENERRDLAQALSLPPESDSAAIGARLREEAQKLSRAGIHLRLDKNPGSDKSAPASFTLRSNQRPKDDATSALLARVERAAVNLQQSIDGATRDDASLTQLDPDAINLDAGADAAFADRGAAKLAEVKKNLGDARQLIALMHTRAAQARDASAGLLVALDSAVNTDDGSLGPAAGADPHPDTPALEPSKKPHPKAKPALVAPAPAARAKPPDDEATPPPAKPNKAPPAPRDFEP